VTDTRIATMEQLGSYSKSEPGAVATGSIRMHDRSSPIRQGLVVTGGVDLLGNDPVATAPRF
jgi:hypothetical protein